jgi:RNA polymerase sigma factor (TIGR02999 family)
MRVTLRYTVSEASPPSMAAAARHEGGGGGGVDPVTAAVPGLLARLDDGDADAADQLFTLLYDEMRRLARRQRARWHGDETLNTTALVHEAYLKLVGQARIGVESRTHFLALAARAMRHVLCNYARGRRARKRGGDAEVLTLEEASVVDRTTSAAHEELDMLMALDAALRRLEELDPRQARVVECRFFGGLTVNETASALGVSPRTVERDWALAQAWLHREVAGDG